MIEKITMAFYNTLILFFSPFILAVFFIKQMKHHKNPLVHFGRGMSIMNSENKPVWIHAVSVGEVHLLKALVGRLLKDSNRVVISTVTKTGNDAAKRLFGDSVDLIYFPIDYKIVVKRCINRINPKLILLVETEIWPNFLCQAYSKKIPIVLINGRISIRSSDWYRRFKFFFKPLISKIDLICVQNENEKSRFAEYADSAKIRVTGNIKYSNIIRLKCRIDKLENKTILIAGSTHNNEEEIIFRIYKRLNKCSNLFLIVAPRHVDRVKEVINMAKSFDMRPELLSCFSTYESCDMLIVDTIGDLSSLYGIADIAFVGGSMVGTGGHNPLEACLYSVPVIMGHSYFNFDEIVGELKDSSAIMIADDEADLAGKISELIENCDKRKAVGEAGFKVLCRHLDNLEKTVNLIADYL